MGTNENTVLSFFITYGYNGRSELVFAAKNAEDAKEHEYGYDDIGNRVTSSALSACPACR